MKKSKILKKVLITGGAGFIGSHLAECLVREKNDVTIIDDLSTGSMDNILHLNECSNFHSFIDTIMNEGLMSWLVRECDEIYHLAAAVGVKLIVESPVEVIFTNIIGTEIVLRLASKFNKKVLVTSTSEIYGKSEDMPYKEESDRILGSTTKSRWSYSSSKAIDEYLALAYCKEKSLDVVIVRLFNTVGPKQTGMYGMVIPRFVAQALRNESITVYGDGQQSRTFAFVNDVVDAMISLMKHPESSGEIFNVGSKQEITIEGLAKLVKKMVASESDIVHIPYDKAYEKGFEDMRRRIPDTEKIEKFIGWSSTTKLEEILKSVITYEKGKKNANENF
jgi:UDP-glucose 4-epimerase